VLFSVHHHTDLHRDVHIEQDGAERGLRELLRAGRAMHRAKLLYGMRGRSEFATVPGLPNSVLRVAVHAVQWLGATVIQRSLSLGLGCAVLAALALSCGEDEQVRTADAGSAGSAAGGNAGSAPRHDATAGSGGGAGSSSSDGAIDGEGGEAGAIADASADGVGEAGGLDAEAGTDAGDAMATLMPSFGLYDVNPSSPRYQDLVAPKDYQGQISAWYFGHAT
jgi:hypothetical protein